MHGLRRVRGLSCTAAACAALAVMGISRLAQAQNIVASGSSSNATSWTGTPVYETGDTPVDQSGGTTNDNDSWGGNANGSGGFGALAQMFEVTTPGTLATAQLTMAGATATFNVELYDEGPVPAGYQAASGSTPTITQINNVGNVAPSDTPPTITGGTNLLKSGDGFTYTAVASTNNLETLTFQGADANVQLVTGELYMLSLDPTANADSTWWVRGGLPTAAYNTGEGLNADGVAGLQDFEGKTSVRDFDLGITEAAVPEPATLGLLGIGCLGLLKRRRSV